MSKTKHAQVRLLATTAIFSAMITVMTAFIGHIPIGTNGGYIHFGDSLIFLAASILPTPYALFAAAIGGGLADLLTAPIWTPATIIIKIIIAAPFTCHKDRILHPRNILASILAFFTSAIGYYLAESILFGSKAALFSAITGSIIQGIGSMLLFYILGIAFDKIELKKHFK